MNYLGKKSTNPKSLRHLQSLNMNLPHKVVIIKEEGDLKQYHYLADAPHPGPADFWKGITMDGNRVVAQSFPWAPTVVTNDLPTDQVYTPLYESTVVRFYVHDGKPMVSTHRQINISNNHSRTTPSSTLYIELIKKAISSWSYNEQVYETTNGGTGYEYTPSSWEELCVDGWCHVFLLVDQSNQITDLTDLSITNEMLNEKLNELEVVTFASPRLIHTISFQESDEMNDDGIYPMIPFSGKVVLKTPDDKYDEYTWSIPYIQVMTPNDAEDNLAHEGAVIGFSPLHPEITTKYLSPEYAHKLDLAGETFNAVHRWHLLMDEGSDIAAEYLRNLPWHLKYLSFSEMTATHGRYVDKIVVTVAKNVVDRYNRKDASLDRALYNKVGSIITDTVSDLRTLYLKNTPSEQVLRNEAEGLVLQRVLTLSYAEQHAINGAIQRIEKQQQKQ